MESTSEDCATQGSNIPAYRMVGTIIFIVFIYSSKRKISHDTITDTDQLINIEK